MAGEFVPVVLVPRFTTFVGGGTGNGSEYVTIGMDVSPYSGATVSAWFGKYVGTATALKAFFEESGDQVLWSICSGTDTNGESITAETEKQVSPIFKRRWFRLRLRINTSGAVDAAVTGWVSGFLEQRES